MCRCTNNAAVELAVFRACFLALRTAVVRQFVERVWQFAPRFLSYNDVHENGSKKAAFVSSCFLFVLDLENFASVVYVASNVIIRVTAMPHARRTRTYECLSS